MENTITRLPIGVSNISDTLSRNYAYIDKTTLIHALIKKGKYYFFARPRCFGKSLLISTLKEIFLGNKELFQGCAIYSSDYSWPKHPVIHLDFTHMSTSIEDLEKDLKTRLIEIGKEYGHIINPDSARTGLRELVKILSQKAQVVILVDAYDRPIVENLNSLEKAQKIQKFLQFFFGMLKALDVDLEFVFFTSVNKFTQASLFSGLNNLNDITMHPEYSTLLGYTEDEVCHFLGPHLKHFAEKHSQSVENVIEKMRPWYNGYRFSKEGNSVYNPHSTLLFLNAQDADNYRFNTTFLIKKIKQEGFPVRHFNGIEIKTNLRKNYDVETLGITSLMWQLGYLTIRNYDEKSRRYTLDYPNLGVQTSFFKDLAKEFVDIPEKELLAHLHKLLLSLSQKRLEDFFQEMRVIFSNIPHGIHEKRESYYQSIFFIIIQLMGFLPCAEERTNVGRFDTVIKTDNFIYIIEFKVDSTADEALAQIHEKGHFQKYMSEGKKLILVGINFSTEKQNISDWKQIPVDNPPS